MLATRAGMFFLITVISVQLGPGDDESSPLETADLKKKIIIGDEVTSSWIIIRHRIF